MKFGKKFARAIQKEVVAGMRVPLLEVTPKKALSYVRQGLALLADHKKLVAEARAEEGGDWSDDEEPDDSGEGQAPNNATLVRTKATHQVHTMLEVLYTHAYLPQGVSAEHCKSLVDANDLVVTFTRRSIEIGKFVYKADQEIFEVQGLQCLNLGDAVSLVLNLYLIAHPRAKAFILPRGRLASLSLKTFLIRVPSPESYEKIYPGTSSGKATPETLVGKIMLDALCQHGIPGLVLAASRACVVAYAEGLEARGESPKFKVIIGNQEVAQGGRRFFYKVTKTGSAEEEEWDSLTKMVENHKGIRDTIE